MMSCIGGCGTQVAEDKFGCSADWTRLRTKQPVIAARIIATYREVAKATSDRDRASKSVAHLLALGDGRFWFRANPLKSGKKVKEPKGLDELWI